MWFNVFWLLHILIAAFLLLMLHFMLASADCFSISLLLMLSFLLNTLTLILYYVAHFHLKWMVIDHRYQVLIVITLLNTHILQCLHPMSFYNPGTTQSHPKQQCNYCQQDSQGLIEDCVCETVIIVGLELFPYTGLPLIIGSGSP